MKKSASFTKRLFAIIYDGILIVALLLIASAIATVINDNQPIAPNNLWMSAWLFLVGFLYYGVSWKISGQTLGLRTWRLRLVTTDKALDWQLIIVRYFLGLLLFLSIIGFVWILFDKNKQTLYDKLTHTKIIDEKS